MTPSHCGSTSVTGNSSHLSDASFASGRTPGSAGLGCTGDGVADAGVGFAEQDFVLLDRFEVSHITGIDITPVTSIRAGNASPSAGWRNKSTFDSVPRPQWSFPTHRSKKSWPWNAHSTLTRVINSCAKHFASSNQEEPLRSPTLLPNPGKKPGPDDRLRPKVRRTFSKPITMIGRNTAGAWLPRDSAMSSWNRSGKTCTPRWPSTSGSVLREIKRWMKWSWK